MFSNPGTTETTCLAAVAASKASYVLALHESSAAGIAASYALITCKPAAVSLHTHPGLDNGMFKMCNALMSGIPLLVPGVLGVQCFRQFPNRCPSPSALFWPLCR